MDASLIDLRDHAAHDEEGLSHQPPRWYVVMSRLRGVVGPAGIVIVVASLVLLAFGPRDLSDAFGLAAAVGLALYLVGVALAYWPATPRMAAQSVRSPLKGRLRVLNSPASHQPSHGTHGLGQTFAIDLVPEPVGPGPKRPRFNSGAGFRDPEEFPGFGQSVVAPVTGHVVKVVDGVRDHRSRSSWPAFAYLLLESMVRAAGGRRFLIGNHVVIEEVDGSHALLAHLQEGSIVVSTGQRVFAGEDVIGRCGNSGNSSEPHVHLQLMDHANPATAAGLPLEFEDASVELPQSDTVVRAA